MSPPVVPTRAISTAVSSEKTSTADMLQSQRGGRDVPRDFHRATNEKAPVISMNSSASMAAPWCLVIRASETPGAFWIAPCAPVPLKNVTIASRAMAGRIMRLARLRSWFFPSKDTTSRPTPITVPRIGK